MVFSSALHSPTSQGALALKGHARKCALSVGLELLLDMLLVGDSNLCLSTIRPVEKRKSVCEHMGKREKNREKKPQCLVGFN